MPVARRGMALILVAGLLGLLLFLASALVGVGRLSRAAVQAGVADSRARLSSESGLEYAAARLIRDPVPVRHAERSAENAGDDWACRDEAPPSRPAVLLQTPSYRHGEPWNDADGDGRFDAGEELDPDGDGRIFAASGRLRGAVRPEAFTLRIGSASGRVCVNSGEIGSPWGDIDLDGRLDGNDPFHQADMDFGFQDHDSDAVPNYKDPDFAGPLGNGVPDWRDPAFPGNVHLVNLLNNLGAILDLTSRETALYWPADSYVPPLLGTVETSALGTLVVANRPKGGYASIDQLGALLPPSDYEKAAPYLSVSGDAVQILVPDERRELGFFNQTNAPLEVFRCETHARIDFNQAPVEILKANLRYVTASGTYHRRSDDGTIETDTPFVRLDREEADRVAETLAAFRPLSTWKEFLDVLHRECWALHEDDPFTYATADEYGDTFPPFFDEALDPSLKRLKEDLILAQVCPHFYFGDTHAWRANGLEVPREGGGTDGPITGPDRTSMRRILKGLLSGSVVSHPFYPVQPAPGGPYVGGALWNDPGLGDHLTGLPSRATTEFSLGVPRVFAIEAGSDRHVAWADLSLADGVLRLASQQDFELAGASPGSPWHYPGGWIRGVAPCAEKNGIDTFPKFPLDAYEAAGMGPLPWVAANDRYPPAAGGLCLSARAEEALEGDCLFSLPFNPDPPSAPPNRWYDATDWLDQVNDPVGTPALHRSPPTQGFPADAPEKLLHQGVRSGPTGPRAMESPEAGNAFWTRWLAPEFPFPALIAPRELGDFTIVAWYPARGSDPVARYALSAIPSIELRYRYTSGTKGLFRIALESDERATYAKDFGPPPALKTFDCPWLGDPALCESGWHHLAAVFRRVDADTMHPEIYLDGVPLAGPGDPPADADYFPHSSISDWRLVFSPPIDDVRLFKTALPAPQVRALARENRFLGNGSYRSGRFAFDAARLPRGASITGLAWDAFVPELSGGTFHFDVVGYDGPDPLNPPQDIPADGTARTYAPLSVPRCREMEFRARIDAAPTMRMDGQPVLRDAPVLNAVEIRYSAGPRWTSYASGR